MSEYLETYAALGRGLDLLSLTGLTVAGLALIAFARQYYVRFSTPPACPVRPWYPIPDDLPSGPVSAYGAAALRRTYRPALTLGVNGSAALHVSLIAAAFLAARAWNDRPVPIPLPPEPPDRPLPPTDVLPPPALDPRTAETAPKRYVPGPPPLPMGRLVIPVADSRESLLRTILTQQDDLGPTTFDPSESSIWGHGTGPLDKPGDGLFGGGPGDETVVPLTIVEQLPELVTIPAPVYPEAARLSQSEGVVGLRLLVGTNGRVREVRIEKSIPSLDDAARAAAVQAVFRPARWQNKPVAVWVTLPIRFSLE